MRLIVVSGDGSSWSQGGVLIHSSTLPPPVLLRLPLARTLGYDIMIAIRVSDHALHPGYTCCVKG